MIRDVQPDPFGKHSEQELEERWFTRAAPTVSPALPGSIRPAAPGSARAFAPAPPPRIEDPLADGWFR